MNIEKQIMDMEIALREAQHELDKAWHECLQNNGKQPEREFVFCAKYLVENKGYRKATDVAREIFDEIDRMIYRLLNDRHYIVGDMCYEVEELKKKWEVEEWANTSKEKRF